MNKNDSILIETLFNDLTESWNLGINEEVAEPVDIRLFNKFKSLFDSTATIDDEFNAQFKHDPALNPPYAYIVESGKPFNDYAHDVALQVVQLTIDSAGEKKLISSVNNKYVYEIYRKVSAYKYRKYVLDDAAAYFKNEISDRKLELDKSESIKIYNNSLYNAADSVYKFISENILIVTVHKSDGSIKIAQIKRKEENNIVKCENDSDNDGILNNEDVCPGKFGDFTARGCPDHDFDTIPDSRDRCPDNYGLYWNHGCPWNYFNNKFAIGIFTGVRLNSCPLKLPEPDKGGYSSVDMNESKKGSLKNPELISSTVFGADISYYTGSIKKKGISLGVNYTSFIVSYIVADNAVYTFKSNDGSNDYRRRVTLKQGSEEKLNYQVLNFPLLLKYRGRFNKSDREKKSFYEFSAGPSLVYFKNKSDYNVNIAFEGLYQVDTINKDQFKYYDYFDNGSTWNVLLTSAGINHQSSNPGVDSLYNQLFNADNRYDFAASKNYTGADRKAVRLSVAVNANADFYYQVRNMAIRFGAAIVVARSLNSISDYAPMDKTSDNYNSFFRSKASSVYISYGLNFGFSLGF